MFELAKKQRGAESEEEESEDGNSDIDTPEEEGKVFEEAQGGIKKKKKKVKPIEPLDFPEDCHLKAASNSFFEALPTQD